MPKKKHALDTLADISEQLFDLSKSIDDTDLKSSTKKAVKEACYQLLVASLYDISPDAVAEREKQRQAATEPATKKPAAEVHDKPNATPLHGPVIRKLA